MRLTIRNGLILSLLRCLTSNTYFRERRYRRSHREYPLRIRCSVSVFILTLLLLTTPSNASLSSLEKALQHEIQQHRGTVGLFFYDIESKQSIGIKETELFNPASVIKIPVMVECFRQVESGLHNFDDMTRLRHDHILSGSGQLQFQKPGQRYSLKRLLDQMMIHSDNTATNILIEFLGIEHINNTLLELDLDDTILGTPNLLDADGINLSAPKDMAKLLLGILTNRILSKQSSKRMITLMTKQKYRWGIPYHLPSTLKIANKTGTLAHVRNDCAIIYYPESPYILTIFTKDIPKAKALIAQLSYLVYTWKTHHPHAYP